MPGIPPNHELFVRSALPSYGRDPGSSVKLLSLSENATYLVDDENPIVLRVRRPGYHSLAAIESELAWMSALSCETCVLTPGLISAVDGRRVVIAELGDTSLHIDAVTFVPGCTAEEDPGSVGFDEVGRITAVMHGHARNWSAPREFTRFRWDLDTILGPKARWGDWRLAPGLSTEDRRWIQLAVDQIVMLLTKFGCAPDRWGLIHADLRMANLMIDPIDPGSGITAIDFDDCGWSWFLADLGAAVSFIEDTPLAERIITDWLSGYFQVGVIPRAHLTLVPTFVMMRRIMLTAWIASHYDADAAIDVGEQFGPSTARLAQRYITDPTWLRDAVDDAHYGGFGDDKT